MHINTHINNAAKKIPITWPLTASIAVNPLWDLHDKSIEDAIGEMNRYLPIKGLLDINEYADKFSKNIITDYHLQKALQKDFPEIDRIVLENKQIASLLCKALKSDMIFKKIDEIEQSSIAHETFSTPTREHLLDFITLFFNQQNNKIISKDNQISIFSLWREHIKLNNPSIAKSLIKLPNDVDEAIHFLLNEININENDIPHYFEYILTSILGWSSFIKWLESRPSNPFIKSEISLKDIITIWLCYDYFYKKGNNDIVNIISQNTNKRNYLNTPIYDLLHSINSFNELLKEPAVVHFLKSTTIRALCFIWQSAWENVYHEKIIHSLKREKSTFDRHKTQFVFCIDTRSEGIRRHLETQGHETFGYAGFFGCLFELEDEIENKTTLQCPALVEPTNKINIKRSRDDNDSIAQTLSSAILNSKHSFSPFALFEMTGMVFSVSSMIKNTENHHLKGWFEKIFNNDEKIHLRALLNTLQQIDHTAYIKNAYDFLQSIGLTNNLADLIFICGHQSETKNNPFHASYECGACGGNSGYINSIIACEILNNDTVRDALKKKGIVFGKNTIFVASCHNTVTDELVIFNHPQNPSIPKDIQIGINNACEQLRNERSRFLPDNLSLQSKATHWAEMIPEWGLANNACMIIGPRWLSKSVNLERRTFLHSYEPSIDSSGDILEGILTAPLVVAHWINMQYYFSATDPLIYGSGNKALHNVIPGIGVMEGNMSDLKIGLPLQSLFFRKQRIHEPHRLLVIIYAHQEKIDSILNNHPTIKSIFEGKWATLHVINPEQTHELS